MAGAYQAWKDAETGIAAKLATILGGTVGNDVFIGEKVYLTGKVNIVCFQISDGAVQDQAITSGANCWKANAQITAAYIDRDDAQVVAGKVLENIPITDVTGVSTLYVTNFPKIEVEAVHVANKDKPILVNILTINMGVAFYKVDAE